MTSKHVFTNPTSSLTELYKTNSKGLSQALKAKTAEYDWYDQPTQTAVTSSQPETYGCIRRDWEPVDVFNERVEGARLFHEGTRESKQEVDVSAYGATRWVGSGTIGSLSIMSTYPAWGTAAIPEGGYEPLTSAATISLTPIDTTAYSLSPHVVPEGEGLIAGHGGPGGPTGISPLGTSLQSSGLQSGYSLGRSFDLGSVLGAFGAANGQKVPENTGKHLGLASTTGHLGVSSGPQAGDLHYVASDNVYKVFTARGDWKVLPGGTEGKLAARREAVYQAVKGGRKDVP